MFIHNRYNSNKTFFTLSSYIQRHEIIYIKFLFVCLSENYMIFHKQTWSVQSEIIRQVLNYNIISKHLTNILFFSKYIFNYIYIFYFRKLLVLTIILCLQWCSVDNIILTHTHARAHIYQYCNHLYKLYYRCNMSSGMGNLGSSTKPQEPIASNDKTQKVVQKRPDPPKCMYQFSVIYFSR